MRHPKYNKGLAFTEAERDRMYLRGLLPPAVLSQEVQLERTMLNIRSKSSDLDKYTYLSSLQERNERLFYRVVMENFEELLPIISTPTVRIACQKFGLMFKSLPRALYITLEDRGRVFRILKNWPERNIKVVVVTDGEKVGAVGDLGVQAVGVPISKLSLYTACGGIEPAMCIPVMIDVGTDNEDLLRSPFYVGVRHRRVRGDAYYELLDEFLTAVRRRYGNPTLIHFEDLIHENASKLLNMYRSEFPCFNNDIQCFAAAVLSGIMGALPKTGGALAEHRFILSGEGPQTSCVAELIAVAMAQQTGQTVLDTRRNIWLVDSQGLVTRGRGDSSTLEDYKLPYCHSSVDCPDLLSSIKALKSTVLVGCSTTGPAPFKFDQQVCEAMAANAKHPIIFPLTSRTSEATPHSIYEWTGGRAVVATEQYVGIVKMNNGKELHPSQCTTSYVFPGVGLGTLVSRCTKLRDEQFIAAADAIASMVTDEDRARGSVYPSQRNIREVSARVASAVARKAYEGGFATELPKPPSMLEKVKSYMYNPQYRRYR